MADFALAALTVLFAWDTAPILADFSLAFGVALALGSGALSVEADLSVEATGVVGAGLGDSSLAAGGTEQC